MSDFHRLLFLLLLALPVAPIWAQSVPESAWGDLLEQWAERNDSETVPDDLVELLQGYQANPINLNDTLSTALHDLPFLTDFQCETIRAYVVQNGPFASLAELFLLNGFDTLTLRLLRHFVTVAPVESEQLSLSNVLKKGRGSLLLGAKTTVPQSVGYNDGSYLGSPLRALFRLSYHYQDRVALQLSGDKDADEPFGGEYNPAGFDFYGFYLMFNRFGRLKRAIVGNYNLQFGQGLSLWSGFGSYHSDYQSFYRYGQGIRPASAFGEYGYLCGAAATLSLSRHTELSLFYSHVDRDATTAVVSDSIGTQSLCYQSIYNSGYHRTLSEMGKKDLLGEQFFGTHFQFRTGRLAVGATASAMLLDAPLVPHDYVYNAFAFSGKHCFTTGVDVAWRYRRLLLFGEAAVSVGDSTRVFSQRSGFEPVATVAGAELQLNSNNSLSLAYRFFSPSFQNRFSNAIGQQSAPQNEEGVSLVFHTLLLNQIDFQSSVDIFRHPWMRYRVYSPSAGTDYRLKLSAPVARHMVLSFQFRHRAGDRNSDGQGYYVELTQRQQWQADLDCEPSDHWRLRSRVACTHYACNDHASQWGALAYQEVTWHSALRSQPFSLTGRLAFFDVAAYDTRIFMYENDLQYDFSVPALQGRGVRCYLVYRQQLGSAVALALKYAWACYPDRDTLGSSHDRIMANNRHELKLQLNFKF